MELTDKALRLNRVGMNHEVNHKWSPEKRIEVVTKTLALGNMRLVSELTGVSYQLIREWKTQPWWSEIVDEIRYSRNSQVETKLSKLVDKSLETVADRLENGNLFLDKKGDLQRKPLSALEANKIANDMLNQETLVQKRQMAETEGQQTSSMADIIRDLAKQFAMFNTKRTIESSPKAPDSEIIDAVYRQQGGTTDALYDQRQEGLQETVRELRLTPGPDQETDRAQSGSFDGGEEGESSQGGWDGRGPQDSSEQGWEERVYESEGGNQTSEQIVPAQS